MDRQTIQATEAEVRSKFQRARDHYYEMTETHNERHTFLIRWVGLPVITLTGVGLIIAGVVHYGMALAGRTTSSGGSQAAQGHHLITLGLLCKIPFTCGMSIHKVRRWLAPPTHQRHPASAPAGMTAPHSASN